MIKVKKFISFEELKADQNEAENDELTLKRHEEYEQFFKYLRSLVVENERKANSNKGN